jgi:hypothetical protein
MTTTGTASLTIRADYENNADTWWDAARAASSADDSEGAQVFRRLDKSNASRDEGVSVLADELRAFESWAEALPGFDDGPTHARLPYVVVQD